MAKDTHTRILDRAETLLVSLGYNAFSYADISSEIGIGKATIHHHFSTKADLVAAVLARYRERTRKGVGEMLASTPRAADRLRSYVGYWEHCIRANTMPFCIAALLAAELPSLPEPVVIEVKGHFADLADALKETIRAGVQSGELAIRLSAEDEAQILIASVHGAMLAARVAGGDATLYASITGPALERFLT